MPLVPYVVEKSGREERVFDIYSRLLKDRIVFLGSGVNDEVANSIVAQMLFLQSDDPKADIHFYINSPGGSVTAGLAIYDTMQFVTCNVATYCLGQAASMGAVLLTAGAAALWLLSDETSTTVAVKVPELSSVALAGQKVFLANCAQCHGDTAGGTDQGPPLVHQWYRPGHHAGHPQHPGGADHQPGGRERPIETVAQRHPDDPQGHLIRR